MANPQLIAYIKENHPKFSKETVIQSLQSAGWSAIDISAAFMELEHPVPPSAQPAQKPSLPQRGEFSAENSPTSGAVAPAYVSDKPVSASLPASQMPNPNAAFLAEMEKRRKEAQGSQSQTVTQGDVTISVGATPSASAVAETGLVGMVMKTGLVKNAQQANAVLIGIVIVCLGFSYWFIFG